MFVQITRIAKRSEAVFAFERLEPGVGSYVNFEAILARVYFATVDAEMTTGT